MYKENSVLRAEARTALQGKWSTAVIVSLVYFIIAELCGYGLSYLLPHGTSNLIALFIMLPILWAYNVGFLDLFRGNELSVKSLFAGFSDYKRIFVTQLLVYLYTFLWTLLLIIPGIVKGYSYALTSYILKENPNIAYNQAIEKSMQMMQGNKMKLFLLDLSFIGWALLTILTFGVGLLLLAPYMVTSHAAFYENLKQEQEQGM